MGHGRARRRRRGRRAAQPAAAPGLGADGAAPRAPAPPGRRPPRPALHHAGARPAAPRGDDPRPDLLRPPGVARTFEDPVLPQGHPHRGAPGIGADLRERLHRSPPARARAPALPRPCDPARRRPRALPSRSTRRPAGRRRGPGQVRGAHPVHRLHRHDRTAQVGGPPRAVVRPDVCRPPRSASRARRHSRMGSRDGGGGHRRSPARRPCHPDGIRPRRGGTGVVPARRGGGLPVGRGGVRDARPRGPGVRRTAGDHPRVGDGGSGWGRGAAGPVGRYPGLGRCARHARAW